jgi:hypothetical protein
MAVNDAIQGLTDAVRLLVVQVVELRREVRELRELRDKQGAQIGWGDWAKTHPWPAALVVLSFLLALSGQLQLLPSFFGAVVHAIPLSGQ